MPVEIRTPRNGVTERESKHCRVIAIPGDKDQCLAYSIFFYNLCKYTSILKSNRSKSTGIERGVLGQEIIFDREGVIHSWGGYFMQAQMQIFK